MDVYGIDQAETLVVQADLVESAKCPSYYLARLLSSRRDRTKAARVCSIVCRGYTGGWEYDRVAVAC